MKLVITGGTGFLGRHLTSYLGDLGHEISLIQRSDLKQGAVRISKLIKSSDVIINLAGSPVIKRWTSANKNEMLYSRINTTNLLVEAVTSLHSADRPKIFLSASAIGIYNSTEIHNESSSGFDTNFLANVCRDWEVCLEPLKKLNIRICVLRIGIVLGKDGGMLKKLIPLFKLALGGKIGSGQQSFSFVHYHDFCRIVSFLIDNSQCGGVFNLTAPEISTNIKFTAILAKAFHLPAFFSVPEFALKLVYGEAAVTLIKGQAVYPQHLLDSGYQFQYPDLSSAIGDILAVKVKH
jgi:uncharacterized protein (TIGR01777 family)